MRQLRTLVVTCILATAAGAPFAAQEEDLSSAKLRVEWDEFKPLYDAGKVVVVDVRGADAFEAGHIPGALSVPLAEVERRADELKALKKPIVVYCA
ncbi:MAG: rhodanese-like domain-containing protein [Acidobacteria bacterium]|nr:rhodanese-like domain-containing protein [Acidobacteriota bacterium]